MDDAISYFAYGAMMSPQVVRRRGIAIVDAEPAVVKDHALVFDIAGIWIVEPAFASIVASPESEVHGVLYRLAPDAMARLDSYEGPEYRTLDVTAIGASRGSVSARTYQTIAPVTGRRPSRRYLRLLCEAARERGLPDAYVDELARHPFTHIPVLSPIAEACLGVAERVVRRSNQRAAQKRNDDAATP